MSVSRDSEVRPVEDEVDDYEDLYFQDVNFVFEPDETAYPASDQVTWSIGYDVLRGEMDRWDVAELVAIIPKREMATLLEAGGAGTTPGTAQADWELYRAPTTVYDNFTDADTGTSATTALFNASHTVHPDLLYQTMMPAFMPFNDTVNGTGGGGAPGYGRPDPVLFRDWYGRGPMFEHDENLHLGGNLQWWDIDNVRIRCSGGYRAVWDLFRREEPQLIEKD